MKKILVPVDGSASSTLAIEKAKELAKALGSHITLLHVIGIYPGAFPVEFSESVQISLLKESRVKAKEILLEGKQRLADLGEKVDMVILEGNVASEIINYADGHDIDLVIMGSRGLSGVNNLLLGSVTRKVAIQVSKPILIIK